MKGDDAAAGNPSISFTDSLRPGRSHSRVHCSFAPDGGSLMASALCPLGTFFPTPPFHERVFIGALSCIPTPIARPMGPQRSRGMGSPSVRSPTQRVAASRCSVSSANDPFTTSRTCTMPYGVLDVHRRMCSSAFFSRRLTCACEIPISPATSIWVRP